MTWMADRVLDLEPDLAVSVDAELGLLGLLADGGSAGLVAGVADPGLPVPVGLATGLLAGVDPSGLDGDARVDLIRAWERLAAVVAAGQQRAIAAVAAATEGLGRPGEEARHEVGAALRLSPGTAGDRLEVALELVRRLPAVQAALAAGAVGYLQAAAIAAGVRHLPDPLAVSVADRVLVTAPEQTVAETKRAVARAAATVDPVTAADRHATATAHRTIEQMPQPDGMESTWATMPASVSKDLWAALTADAQAAQADRTAAGLPFVGLNALRVDALVHAVLGNGGADPQHPTMTTTSHPATGPSDGDGNNGDSGGDGAPGEAAGAVAPAAGPPPPAPPGPGCPGAGAAARRPRRWCSTWRPWSAFRTGPGRSPATARSPRPPPGRWPRTGTGSAGWSTPAPAPCSTSAPTGTARRTRCAGSSPPGTAAAGSPAAPSRPTSATATT